MSESPFISRFSPNRTDPDILEAIHVSHQDHQERAFESVQRWLQGGESEHLLFVGPRGAGKTHLVTLLNYQIAAASASQGLRIAWLGEDETSVSFLDLLERIYRALVKKYPVEFEETELEAIYGSDPKEAQHRFEKLIAGTLKDRKCLILIENLDSVFDGLDEGEQMAWRAFYQNNSGTFATVATAQRLVAEATSQQAPFHGFFEIHHIKPFGVAEAIQLLQAIAKSRGEDGLVQFLGTAKGRARIHAIRRLSGGNPRLFVILADFINPESLDELVRPLENLVDEQLTPYYQERLRWLSPLQRKIVEFLCRSRGAVEVKTIAAGLFKQHSSIAGQLKQLLELGYVNRHPIGREALYELAEPLMRLSLQVKETTVHEPLELIVDVLRVWCEQEEIEKALTSCGDSGLVRNYLARVISGMVERNLWCDLVRQDFPEPDLKCCSIEDLEVLLEVAKESEDSGDWARLYSGISGEGFNKEKIRILTSAIESPGMPAEVQAWYQMLRGLKKFSFGKDPKYIEDWCEVCTNRDAPPTLVADAEYLLATAKLLIGEWEEGAKRLAKMGEEDVALISESVVGLASQLIIVALLYHSDDRERLSVKVGALLKAIKVKRLRVSFAASLPGTMRPSLSINDVGTTTRREDWVSTWERRAAGMIEFRVPLRILRACCDYLNGGRDEKVLLRLAAEERAMVHEALASDPFNSDPE